MQRLFPALATPDAGGRDVRVTGLAGAAAALFLTETARAQRSPCLVVTASTTDAYRLEEELKFFAGDDLPVLHFPDWETLPYDNFSPHQDLVSQRLETLSRLPHLQQALLVVPVGTLLHRVCPPAFVAAACAFAPVHACRWMRCGARWRKAATSAWTPSTSTASSRCAARCST